MARQAGDNWQVTLTHGLKARNMIAQGKERSDAALGKIALTISRPERASQNPVRLFVSPLQGLENFVDG